MSEYQLKRTGNNEVSVVIEGLTIPIASDLNWHVGQVISEKVLQLSEHGFGVLKQILVDHGSLLEGFVKICHGYNNNPGRFLSEGITIEQFNELSTLNLLTPSEIDEFTRHLGREDKNPEPESTETDGRTKIYLIRDNRTGLTKIGQSFDPVRRLRALIQQDTLLPEPNDFILLHSWEAPGRIERQLHEQFREDRVRGEWFRLNESQIAYLKRLG